LRYAHLESRVISKTLFVGNLRYSITEERLRALFEASGSVISARVVLDQETQRPKGFGFVEFEAADMAAAAIAELSGRLVDGRELVVNEARPRAISQSDRR
jgi:RNA recognition motif-containing protein